MIFLVSMEKALRHQLGIVMEGILLEHPLRQVTGSKEEMVHQSRCMTARLSERSRQELQAAQALSVDQAAHVS